jgi:hypothetical protein
MHGIRRLLAVGLVGTLGTACARAVVSAPGAGAVSSTAASTAEVAAVRGVV